MAAQTQMSERIKFAERKSQNLQGGGGGNNNNNIKNT
jgi:hypothetical protein